MNKFRLVTLLSIVIITPLGFTSKFYVGSGAKWINNSFGGILYEIFWCLVISFILIKARAWKIALSVFILTSALEFLQLWHPVFLEVIKSTFIGRTSIGTTFVPADFVYYALGSLAGWILLEKIRKLTNS